MERIFALYDSDENYAVRFMEYFKKTKDFSFELVIFTCFESLKDYIRKHHIDVLLLGEHTKVDVHEINSTSVRHIYKLTDKVGVDTENGYSLINKYQMVQAIISEVKADYIRYENELDHTKPENVKLISIFSPVQDIESVVFAWSAGLLLSEMKRTLLVSLELLPVNILATTSFDKGPLTELVYYIKEGMDILSRHKELVAYQGSLIYLVGLENGADILTLTKDDIQRWVTALKTQAEYDEILFYICSNSEAAQELAILSDKLIYCGKDNLYANFLYKEWLRQLERIGVVLSQDKIIKLTLPEETMINRLPITSLELSNSDCWYYAKQNLNKFLKQ